MSWSWELSKLLSCKCFPCSALNVFSSCCAAGQVPISQCSTTGGLYLALLFWQGSMNYAVQRMRSACPPKPASLSLGQT